MTKRVTDQMVADEAKRLGYGPGRPTVRLRARMEADAATQPDPAPTNDQELPSREYLEKLVGIQESYIEQYESRLQALEYHWCIEGDYVDWPPDASEPKMAECPVAQAMARLDAALTAEQRKRLAAEARIAELEAELASWRSNATPG